MTYSEFYRRISDLPTKFQNRDLETYLSALFVLVDQNQNMQLDGEKLLSLIEQAFTSQAIPFDNNYYFRNDNLHQFRLVYPHKAWRNQPLF